MHPTLKAFKSSLITHDLSAITDALHNCDDHMAELLAARNYTHLASFLKSLNDLGVAYLTHRNCSFSMSQNLAPFFRLSADECLKVRFNTVASYCASKVDDFDSIKLMEGFSRQGRPAVCHEALTRARLEDQFASQGLPILKAFATALAAHSQAKTTPSDDWVNFALAHEGELIELAPELKLGADLAVSALRFGLKDLLASIAEWVVTEPAHNDLSHLIKLEEIGEVFDQPRKRELFYDAKSSIAELINQASKSARITITALDTLKRAIQVHDYFAVGDYAKTCGRPTDMWMSGDVADVADYIWHRFDREVALPLAALLSRDFPELEQALAIKDDLPYELFREIDCASAHCLETDLGL
jgi:hypothetical protein